MMNHTEDVLTRIRERYPHMSKGQKKLADHITQHYDKVVYMTAAKLGQTVGVSESTVVRFADELGYDGYPAMAEALEKLAKDRLTSVQRIEVSDERLGKEHILTTVLHEDIDNLKATLEHVDETAFSETVQLLKGARRIYILGVRSCASLAGFLSFYLNFICEDVRLIQTNSISETFEQMMNVGAEDVFIGISFPRYSRRTARVMEFAKSRGCTCIAITDADQSPLANLADQSLLCRSNMISFADSLVAPLSVINALIVALSREKQEEIKGKFTDLESIWMQYDVYNSGDSGKGL